MLIVVGSLGLIYEVSLTPKTRDDQSGPIRADGEGYGDGQCADGLGVDAVVEGDLSLVMCKQALKPNANLK